MNAHNTYSDSEVWENYQIGALKSRMINGLVYYFYWYIGEHGCWMQSRMMNESAAEFDRKTLIKERALKNNKKT